MSKYSKADRLKVYDAALCRFGPKAQILMAVEEMSELTKEICKYFRTEKGVGPDISGLIDEISDVSIMIEQLKYIFDLDEDVDAHMDAKIERLKHLLGM